ncbi:hypothetical protein ACFQUU_25940 [Herbaspirillum sp. GCM10030257]|uniref:hypothetical protein n=1 Tax=Herbaspirillum sp. GCM10030257 TaxID=3273393 RepID=UPI00360DA69A
MKARALPQQEAEAAISACALNIMTHLGCRAPAKGLTHKDVDDYAARAQQLEAELQVCGARYSPTYTALAEKLDRKFFSLLDAANVDLQDRGLHYRKIEAYMSLGKATDNGPEQERSCAATQTLSERQITNMDEKIMKLKRGLGR